MVLLITIISGISQIYVQKGIYVKLYHYCLVVVLVAKRLASGVENISDTDVGPEAVDVD